MSTHVRAHNIGEAWLASLDALSTHRWDIVNLTVTIDNPGLEDLGIRRALELELARRVQTGAQPAPQSVHTVANTLFPLSLYVPGRDDSADRFFEAAIAGQRSRHGTSARWGTYIGRFVDYPGPKGRANQLALLLEQLRAGGVAWKDRYELAASIPDQDGPPDADDQWREPPATLEAAGHNTARRPRRSVASARDLRVISDPHSDHHARGGPCLAHVSLTMFDDRLHLTAIYRRQSYVARAYGNFLGLARLQHFLAAESGHQVGELMIIATHAEAEGTGCGDLLRAATAAEREIQPIETEARALGRSWRDLDLPQVS